MKKLVLCAVWAVLLFVPFGEITRPAMAAESLTIQKQLDENLFVDASVNIHVSASQQVSTLHARPQNWDIRKVREILDCSHDIIHEEVSPGMNALYGEEYRAEFGNKAYLIVNGLMIGFDTEFGTIFHQLAALETVLDDEALAGADLSFSTREGAQQLVLDTLNNLGIRNARCIAIYTLQHEKLKMYTNKMINDPDLAEDIKAGRIDYQREWGSKDDCYQLWFALEQASIPWDSAAYSYIGGGFYSEGCTIKVLLSAGGIESLHAYSPLDVISSDSPQALMTAEQVPELIRNYFRNMILSYRVTISEMELVYSPIPVPDQNDTVLLVPAWRCTLWEDYPGRPEGGPDPSDMYCIAFDARNGQLLYEKGHETW